METISVTHNSAHYSSEKGASLFSKFITWSDAQEGNRLLWLGLILTFHGCILTPLAVMAVLLAGTNLTLFMITIVAMGISLVSNLAAMPTKLTIPLFALSILMDLVVIGFALAHGLDISNTYV
ncbi:MAG: hypothetical protein ACXVBJ_09670 [Flavisolibacter sp.]